MDEVNSQLPPRISLPVLSPSGKTETAAVQPMEAEEKADLSLLYTPHVNRTRPTRALTRDEKLLEEKIVRVLRSIFDPEIPVNIYDLGLIYDIEIGPEKDVEIRMTLTAPGCPVAGELVMEVEKRVEMIPETKRCIVEVVWDPPWDRDMMTEAAKLELGIF